MSAAVKVHRSGSGGFHRSPVDALQIDIRPQTNISSLSVFEVFVKLSQVFGSGDDIRITYSALLLLQIENHGALLFVYGKVV